MELSEEHVLCLCACALLRCAGRLSCECPVLCSMMRCSVHPLVAGLLHKDAVFYGLH